MKAEAATAGLYVRLGNSRGSLQVVDTFLASSHRRGGTRRPQIRLVRPNGVHVAVWPQEAQPVDDQEKAAAEFAAAREAHLVREAEIDRLNGVSDDQYAAEARVLAERLRQSRVSLASAKAAFDRDNAAFNLLFDTERGRREELRALMAEEHPTSHG